MVIGLQPGRLSRLDGGESDRQAGPTRPCVRPRGHPNSLQRSCGQSTITEVRLTTATARATSGCSRVRNGAGLPGPSAIRSQGIRIRRGRGQHAPGGVGPPGSDRHRPRANQANEVVIPQVGQGRPVVALNAQGQSPSRSCVPIAPGVRLQPAGHDEHRKQREGEGHQEAPGRPAQPFDRSVRRTHGAGMVRPR